ncbi:MAG: oxidoreductase [Gemmatimonadaceae bacterium]
MNPGGRLIAAVSTLVVLVSRGSAQWAPQASGTTVELRGLSIVDQRTAWVSGMHGVFGRTIDGGTTWQLDSITGAGSLDLRAIQASTASTAWAVSAGEAAKGQARIYGTSDGGRHWSLRFATEQRGVFLDAIRFWDSRHGMALSDPVEGKFFVLVTSDGGATWNRIPPRALPPALRGEGAFAASGSCLTLYGNRHAWFGTGGAATARVFRSSDRGRHWRVAEAPIVAATASAGIFSLAFRDARHGVAVGGDYRRPKEATANVAMTTDGGRTWRPAGGRLPTGYLSAVAFIPGSLEPVLVAVGLAGTAVSDDGGRWSMIDTLAYNSVQFVPGGFGLAIGPAGRIARWVGGAPEAGGKRR